MKNLSNEDIVIVEKLNAVENDVQSKVAGLHQLAKAMPDGKAKDLVMKDISHLLEETFLYLARIKMLLAFGEDILPIAEDEELICMLAEQLKKEPNKIAKEWFVKFLEGV